MHGTMRRDVDSDGQAGPRTDRSAVSRMAAEGALARAGTIIGLRRRDRAELE